MRVSECVACERFPCSDVKHESYVIPGVEVDPERISILLISEATPARLRSAPSSRCSSL